jgi:hypothetical protein
MIYKKGLRITGALFILINWVMEWHDPTDYIIINE